MIYEATSLTPEIGFSDLTATIEAGDLTPTMGYAVFWYRIAHHIHRHGVIPSGDIDGVNVEFIVSGDQFEVLINGLNADFTQTETGFTLEEPPQAGDVIWCEVIEEA